LFLFSLFVDNDFEYGLCEIIKKNKINSLFIYFFMIRINIPYPELFGRLFCFIFELNVEEKESRLKLT